MKARVTVMKGGTETCSGGRPKVSGAWTETAGGGCRDIGDRWTDKDRKL